MAARIIPPQLNIYEGDFSTGLLSLLFSLDNHSWCCHMKSPVEQVLWRENQITCSVSMPYT
jgi:hypothetical protein